MPPSEYKAAVDAGAGHYAEKTFIVAGATAPSAAPKPTMAEPTREELTRTPWTKIAIGLGAIGLAALGLWVSRRKEA